MIVDGPDGPIEYVTAHDGARRLGLDVNPGMIYQWRSRHMVTGYKIGKIVWFRWDELQEVEYATRQTRAGRPRRET